MTRYKAETAFVVVHVSSIDAFYDYARSVVGVAAAQHECARFIDRIAQRASVEARNDGLVVVIDQGWPDHFADALRVALKKNAPTAVWISHDEDTDGWDPLEEILPALFDDANIQEVTLGGFWRFGCVRAVREILRRAGIPVTIDGDLCGSEGYGDP